MKKITPLGLVDNGAGDLLIVVDALEKKDVLPQSDGAICRIIGKDDSFNLSIMDHTGTARIGPFTASEIKQVQDTKNMLLVGELHNGEIVNAREIKIES